MSIQRSYTLPLFAILIAGFSIACNNPPPPVNYSVTVPSPNVIEAQFKLLGHYGIGLSLDFTMPMNLGTVFASPETPQAGFGFGFALNTRVFMKDTWTDFQEVTTLPTGAAFPAWMSGPVVDFTSPALNTHGAAYHLYFGDHDQFYIGIGALIYAINETFPTTNVGFSYYDTKGNAIIGIEFFGPKLGPDGHAVVSGGIFVGTNITPFLPANFPGPTPMPTPTSSPLVSPASEMPSMAVLVDAASRHIPVVINGQPAYGVMHVTGPGARHYRSQRAIKRLINRYMTASRQSN
ncbi:hypothetical protein WDW37_04835 [Bdellovibrionota bacterium FG-1]